MKAALATVAALALWLTSVPVTAQVIDGARNATLAPCPGGTTTLLLETSTYTSLDVLVRAAQLIIVGTVTQSSPSFVANPDERSFLETHSVISIDRLLYGSPPSGKSTSAVLVTQMGGEVPPCKLIISDDPLMKVNQRFILFLRLDGRAAPPNTTAWARYSAVGVWSGKAEVVNGKVQFPRSADKGLHAYDNTEANAFIATVASLIKRLRPQARPLLH